MLNLSKHKVHLRCKLKRGPWLANKKCCQSLQLNASTSTLFSLLDTFMYVGSVAIVDVKC